MSKSLLKSLDGMLPDNRPLLSLQIVENVNKCPAGYWPVSRTYDEDSDAGLYKQQGLFGKKSSHYICISKSEGLPGYVMDGIAVVGEREAPPAGFGVAGRAGKRRVCTRVSRQASGARVPPLTDVIVCSKMRVAPQGFILAGEINGKMVCYKLSGSEESPTQEHNYENVISNTPELNKRLRAAPERPPKTSPIVPELNKLNLKNTEDFTSSHDYESLNPSYNIKPTRPAPPAPAPAPASNRNSFSPPSNRNSLGPISPAPNRNSVGPISPPISRHKKGPAPMPRACNYNTLGSYSSLDGVPFILNPKLSSLSMDMGQLPVIRQRTRAEIEKEFSYDFLVERQT